MSEEKKIGKVIHYYPHVPAAVLSLDEPLKVGDKVHFLGHGADVTQTVESMEIDHKPATSVTKGEVAMKVAGKVHEGAEVFLVTG